jgi:hypothetical protein
MLLKRRIAQRHEMRIEKNMITEEKVPTVYGMRRG